MLAPPPSKPEIHSPSFIVIIPCNGAAIHCVRWARLNIDVSAQHLLSCRVSTEGPGNLKMICALCLITETVSWTTLYVRERTHVERVVGDYAWHVSDCGVSALVKRQGGSEVGVPLGWEARQAVGRLGATLDKAFTTWATQVKESLFIPGFLRACTNL